MKLNVTHGPMRLSWVAPANTAETDFPIRHLPFGRWRRAGSGEPWRLSATTPV